MAVLGLGTSVTALDPVEAYGNKLFNKDGSQFFIKGELPLIDTLKFECVLLMPVRDRLPTGFQ